MATSFFGGSFFGGEFFNSSSTPAPAAGFVGGGDYRITRSWTPARPRKAKTIDALIASEVRIKEEIKVAETRGIDSDVLMGLVYELQRLHLKLMELALESQKAYDYISFKRKQAEEEEIMIICGLFDG